MDGRAWTPRRFWGFWRVVAFVTVVDTTAWFELAAMSAMLSDPGRGGDTPEFQRGKSLGVVLFLLVPLAGALASLVVTAGSWLSRRRERRYAFGPSRRR